MKLTQTLLTATALSCFAYSAPASVTYDFLNKGATFDGFTSKTVEIVDGLLTVDMTVEASSGFTLNSNLNAFGIDDGTEDTATIDFIDGTDEIITLSFTKNIEFNFIDLAGIGGSTDGASLTVAGNTVELYTGQSNFNGSTDIYTPPSPILLITGQTILLSGNNVASSFELNAIDLTVVPEPGTYALLSGFSALAFVMLRRRPTK